MNDQAQVDQIDATLMYMSEVVGVAQLRQNLSHYLRRIERGERFTVTDRNRPVAQLSPIPQSQSRLEQLIAEGKLSQPLSRQPLPEPLPTELGARSLSASLKAEREDDLADD